MADEKKMPPFDMPLPPGVPGKKETDEMAKDEPIKNLLAQPNKNKWRYNGPTVMRGDIREAFKLGAQAEKMKCDCWNTHCPFYGNCRKCIVFHMTVKQFPTCQRDMLTELHLNNLFDVELHIQRDENGEPLPEPDWNEMWANGVMPGPGGYFKKKEDK